MPNVEEWCEVIEKVASRWNFPYTMGAIDGKHIVLKAPHNSGTVYHNYKGFFSIILLALVDAGYKLLWVDVEASKSTSDHAVFNQSDLKDLLDNGTFHLPQLFLVMTQRSHTSSFGDDTLPLWQC